MKLTLKISSLILASMLALIPIGQAQDQRVSSEFPYSGQDTIQESDPDLQVSSFEQDNVQNAGIGIRTREVAEWYFYPKQLQSIVSLFGYRFNDIERACINITTSNTMRGEISQNLQIGRIATVNDDSDTRTRLIVANDVDNNGGTEPSQSNESNHTFRNLCESLDHISNGARDASLVIAIEHPIPIVEPSHRYLVRATTLARTASRLQTRRQLPN